jgi:hypothetical protein
MTALAIARDTRAASIPFATARAKISRSSRVDVSSVARASSIENTTTKT